MQERLAALLEERKKLVEKPVEQSGSKNLANGGHKVGITCHPPHHAHSMKLEGKIPPCCLCQHDEALQPAKLMRTRQGDRGADSVRPLHTMQDGAESVEMVEREAKRLEVLKRRQERELNQLVQYELMRKALQVSTASGVWAEPHRQFNAAVSAAKSDAIS